MEESHKNPTAGGGRKPLRRQLSSRIQMHAPASIRIAPGPVRVTDWNVAIPFLSPLDIPDRTTVTEPDAAGAARAREEHNQRVDERGEHAARWSAWEHPAAPFYYEPVPSNQPAFLLPHCA